MGTVDPMFYSGRIGPVIHYRVGDKYITRAMPRKFKQTRATKKRAAEFGRASTIGTSIRGILSPIVPEAPDAKTRGRLVGVVAEFLRNHLRDPGNPYNYYHLTRFRYDIGQSSIRDRWQISLEIFNPSPGQVQVKIPAFVPNQSIKAPVRTKLVVCQISIGSINLKDGMMLNKSKIKLNYDYNDIPVGEQIISVDLPTPKESLVVTAVSLSYGKLTDEGLPRNSNKAFMPAGIINVFVA
jgi:hypothetical protein